MSTVTAVFPSSADADRAIRSLEKQRFGNTQVNYLAPGGDGSSFPVRAPQAGAALGGLSAATFLPGVGPVIAAGMLASGLIGAAVGAAAGAAIGKRTHGVATEDLYFYDEAIRNGQTVVIVDAHDAAEETRARNLLERAGGRSVQALRQEWWQNVGDSYRNDFNGHESDYRQGFEAALHPSTRGREYDQVSDYVETCYGETCRTDAFRAGYDRGQDWFRRRMAARETE